MSGSLDEMDRYSTLDVCRLLEFPNSKACLLKATAVPVGEGSCRSLGRSQNDSLEYGVTERGGICSYRGMLVGSGSGLLGRITTKYT